MSDETVVVSRKNYVTNQEEKCTGEESYIKDKTNKVFVCGRIEKNFEFSHEVMWEKFYKTRVRVARFSGTEDFVPIIVSELLVGREITKNGSLTGKWVEITGQFRSHNTEGDDGRKHLELFLFATKINIHEDYEKFEEVKNSNYVYLDGYLCKQPVFRETPLGKYVTDLIIAVNRPYGRSDYIPCIAWGRLAQWACEFETGNRIMIYGRIQSREYFKKYSQDSDEGEFKMSYEISVMRMQKFED